MVIKIGLWSWAIWVEVWADKDWENEGNYLVQLYVHFLMFLESFIIGSTCFGRHSIHRQEHYCSFCSHRFFLWKIGVFSISSVGCLMLLCVRSESHMLFACWCGCVSCLLFLFSL
jgi:hypothetical protein